jgi:hypothetical protein
MGNKSPCRCSAQCKGALRVALSCSPQPVYGDLPRHQVHYLPCQWSSPPSALTSVRSYPLGSCKLPTIFVFFSLFSLIENTYDRSDGYEHGELSELDEDT